MLLLRIVKALWFVTHSSQSITNKLLWKNQSFAEINATLAYLNQRSESEKKIIKWVIDTILSMKALPAEGLPDLPSGAFPPTLWGVDNSIGWAAQKLGQAFVSALNYGPSPHDGHAVDFSAPDAIGLRNFGRVFLYESSGVSTRPGGIGIGIRSAATHLHVDDVLKAAWVETLPYPQIGEIDRPAKSNPAWEKILAEVRAKYALSNIPPTIIDNSGPARGGRWIPYALAVLGAAYGYDGNKRKSDAIRPALFAVAGFAAGYTILSAKESIQDILQP